MPRQVSCRKCMFPSATPKELGENAELTFDWISQYLYCGQSCDVHIFFWKSKDIDSSLFLRELDEKRNTDRTNLAESITWMKLRLWMHVMTGLISDQMISEIRERLSNISVHAAGLFVITDPYHRDCYNRFVRVPTGLVQKIKTTMNYNDSK